MKLSVIDSDVVYRNPKPHLRAIHAMHPSISQLPNGELICTFDIGQGAESMDYHTVISRSSDGGTSWKLQGSLLPFSTQDNTTHSIRTSVLSDGRMLGLGALAYRKDAEEGVQNRDNMGYVPMDMFIVESSDAGHTWSSSRIITTPFPSPAWELCHPIRELPNGNWYAPVSTWRGWSGELPCGEQSGIFISTDKGMTWPIWGRTFDGRQTGYIHWEQSVVRLENGCLLAMAWVYDPSNGQTHPTVYSISDDNGRNFSAPKASGFFAQTCKLLHLEGNHVLAVYRRNDQPGLWARVLEIEHQKCRTLSEAPLWQGALSGMAGVNNKSDELSGLKFGFPQMQLLHDGNIFLVFWCYEDGISNIRWIRLNITGATMDISSRNGKKEELDKYQVSVG